MFDDFSAGQRTTAANGRNVLSRALGTVNRAIKIEVPGLDATKTRRILRPLT